MSSDAAPARIPSGLGAVSVATAAAAVLVIELSALRVLAPYVGLTLETSTAVIGVALTAIALGAWAGGRLADVGDPTRVVGPLLVAGGVTTWLVLPAVRRVGDDAPLGSAGVLAVAVVAVLIPAGLLSAVTPTVVKLELRSLEVTGAVVGRLSAIGTVGAIVATFGTGFVLFAVVPTSVILFGTGAVLVLLGLVVEVVVRRRRKVAVAASLAAVVISGLLTVAVADPCEAETRYHCATVAWEGPAQRLLLLDNVRHSFVDLEDPMHLEFAYTRAMAAAIEATLIPGPIRALHLGAGGMTLPRYLAADRPGSTGRVVEIDPGVLEIVSEQIGPVPDGVEVSVGDGRVALAAESAASYDLVVGDAFGNIAVPWHLATAEATGDVRRLLTEDGLYALNVIDYPPLSLLRAEVATVRSVFGDVVVIARATTLAGTGGGNAVILASPGGVDAAAVETPLARRDPELAVLSGSRLDVFVGDAAVLTDDLAPVDHLLTTSLQR